jgi:hypothetical protein
MQVFVSRSFTSFFPPQKSILLPYRGFVDIHFSQFRQFNLGPNRVTCTVLVATVQNLGDRALGMCTHG